MGKRSLIGPPGWREELHDDYKAALLVGCQHCGAAATELHHFRLVRGKKKTIEPSQIHKMKVNPMQRRLQRIAWQE